MRFTILATVAAATLIAGAAHAADTLTTNSTPTDTWYFGTGNDYSPANSLVLTTDAGDQIYGRAHETFQVAPASVGNVYSFGTGLTYISFDWGIDSHTGSFDGVSALVTLTNYAGGSFSYDLFAVGNDDEFQSGSAQNSARLNWFPIGFNPGVDSTYNVKLDVSGLEGGPKSINFDVKVGKGFSAGVPEPSSWALMILGFGAVGAMVRRRRLGDRTASIVAG